jgi:hypothetical protein
VVREHRPEEFRVTLIATPACVDTRCISAPVIEQDGGKRTATLWAPEQRPELKVAAAHDYGVRLGCLNFAADHRPEGEQERQDLGMNWHHRISPTRRRA